MTNFEKDRTRLYNHGITTFDNLPEELFNWLKNNISEKIPQNKMLAGHIKKEYRYEIIPKDLEDYLIYHALKDDNLVKYLNSVQILTDHLPFHLYTLWVNLQKKYEFNPIHNHSGIWSFIIPLQIPYDLKKEEKYFDNTSCPSAKTSKLHFVQTNNLGAITEIEVNMDKSFEGKVIMFPSKMMHLVYPFYTSNKYRITVSGNIALKV